MLAEINEVNYTKMFIVSKYESSGLVNFIEKKTNRPPSQREKEKFHEWTQR